MNEECSIQLDINGTENMQIDLMNINGQMIQSQSLTGSDRISTTFNMSQLSSGMYLVRITTKSGVTTQNIIKR